MSTAEQAAREIIDRLPDRAPRDACGVVSSVTEQVGRNLAAIARNPRARR